MFIINPKEKGKDRRPSTLESASKYLLFNPMEANPSMFLGNPDMMSSARKFYVSDVIKDPLSAYKKGK